MDLYNIRKIWNPDWFQGNHKKKSYFEGWYFKIVNPYATAAMAIIPGISHGNKKNDSYPFIQVINGKTGRSHFIRYTAEDFHFSRTSFDISIAGNHFSGKGMILDLNGDDIKLSGEISFLNCVPYPVKFLSPGVMGWYRFVPTMECYHGIVSMNHFLKGTLRISGGSIDFSGGKGYIEKDWGKSMPLAWIWMQSNHFKREELSVSISIANIPWRKSAFTGFLIILCLEGQFYPFTTYNGSRITRLLVKEGKVLFDVRNRDYSLRIEAQSNTVADLQAPLAGEMRRTIQESIGSAISLRLSSGDGTVIFEDTGQPAGMEIAGDVRILQKSLTD